MITVTVPAIAKLKEVCEDNNKPYIRFGVEGGGCAGFNYVMEVADEKSEEDNEFSFGPVKMLVDQRCELFLLGTKVDYKTDPFGSHFVYENPNAKSSCGCGTSFSA